MGSEMCIRDRWVAGGRACAGFLWVWHIDRQRAVRARRVGERARNEPTFAARRAGDKKRGRDGTKYSRTRPASFLTHHMRQISSAAVITDACNIEKEIIGLKISQAPRGA